ncbi:MAG: acyl-CoA dehydrogenase family protein [Burkholderiales bacterium]|nr:acyl-CoA dehydrogenase family protein [Burkholderiales bacterium]
MESRFDIEDAAFRALVREFVRDNLPADMAWRTRHRSFYGGHRDIMAWSRILARNGWAVPHWPVEHGGTGWTAAQLHMFHEETRRADAPPLPYQGPYLVGPVLIAVGSDEQKRRFLPRIASGEDCWCQGFSEPGAGSDLASLRTTALRRADHYVVSGQKLWTSAAHEADWGFFLVRTDPSARPQQGISFLLIDMRSPGVTVRPVILLNGEHHVNEVFLDEVLVPAANLVGEENKGWHYAKTLLGAERTVSAEVYWSENELAKLKEIARRERVRGTALIDDEAFRRRLAYLEIELRALRYSVLRVSAGEPDPVPEGAITSALKLRGSELMQKVAELQVEALGPKAMRYFDAAEFPVSDAAHADDPSWPAYAIAKTGGQLTLRAATIAGGARDVQKNIIAKLAFGL